MKGLEDNEPEFDELDPVRQKKTWVHTVLKGLIYGAVESVVRCASYGTGHKWYDKREDTKTVLMNRIWEFKDLCLQDIADYEGKTIEQLRATRSIQLFETSFRIVITVFDWDPAWQYRIICCIKRFDKERERLFRL
jgi:hypothetical protein